MRRAHLRVIFLLIFHGLSLFHPYGVDAQAYTRYLTGDSSDVVTAHQQGLVLAGGGADNDPAMKWMLQRAAGGDVLVLRASGSNGYNNYFYSDLGIPVNSVETIVFHNISASYDPYVLRRICEAEVVFIAGGDQYDYYTMWRNTPVEDTLRHALIQKRITLGGTSAGMMILGEAYYAPSLQGVESHQALSNPYHPHMQVLGLGDFVNHPWLPGVICDTHFDERDRAGRLSVFMARMEKDWGINARGIACNEGTAVCVDSSGVARVFGSYPPAPDYAYFLQSWCDVPQSLPEQCQPGQPLTWSHGAKALLVYKVVGKPNGSNSFDLTTWEQGTGGQWQWWYADQGQLFKTQGAFQPCNLSVPPPEKSDGLKVSWLEDTFFMHVDTSIIEQGLFMNILSSDGQLVFQTTLSQPGFMKFLPFAPGMYIVTLWTQSGRVAQKKVVKP
ncbi:MAG: Type 1 glutamine amidotransferase-like domain-containing protein [Flavobacteriales bacterium]|nr:Type 1 glutamine amidotransferase-like domain-containing protein [Flavobacteriales bacterium]